MSRILVVGSLAESLVNFRGDLIRHLIAEGHEVAAAAPPGPAWVDETLADWGVPRIRIQLNRTGANVISDLRAFAQLVACIRRVRPDLLLAYTIKPVVYGAIAAKLSGVRRVAAMITGLGLAFTPPSSVGQSATAAAARVLYRAAMFCTDLVFFQNGDDEADFQRFGLLSKRHRVVRTSGSGVNVRRFGRETMPEGPLQFLMIARLLVDKGVREYLQAAHEVRQTRQEVVFHLVGPFEDNFGAVPKCEVESAASRGDVTYHGSVDDVRPFLKACHVFVLPSYREGTPRSVLEALAVGRPVITTDVPGCRETVIPGSNGLLVEARDARALSAAMLRLISLERSELLRMADASRSLAESRFDVEDVNARIATALRDVQARA